MIKTRINNEYKDIIKIFGGGTLQKEITKVWSREANTYVYESEVEYTGTLPITINADGTALIDYCIYGNTVQDGTPTPENPVDVVGCGIKTENLFDKGSVTQNYFMSQNGTVSCNTGAYSDYIPVQPNARYYITKGVAMRSFYSACAYDSTKRFISYRNINIENGVITTPNNCAYVIINVQKINFDVAMFTAGSTAPDSYIPYGYKLPMTVSDGNAMQTVPVYLGEIETTRRIKKLVLTGEENILLRAEFANATAYSYSHYTDDALPYNAAPIICSHFPFLASYADQSDHIYQDTKNFYITSTQYRTVADFKSYLAAQYAAGTPVTVWYVLAEPETGVVNEPLMKIGDYADTVSMEQAGASIPTFTSTTVIDYDGTPKPSQMYIKYRR